jgi:DNA-directed RNA polymerase subunit RPC12/RpoP
MNSERNMRYNFYCHDCKKEFRKDAKRLKTIITDYGEREGIKCPLCKGRAEAKGIVTYLSGESPNGIHDSSKVLEL